MSARRIKIKARRNARQQAASAHNSAITPSDIFGSPAIDLDEDDPNSPFPEEYPWLAQGGGQPRSTFPDMDDPRPSHRIKWSDTPRHTAPRTRRANQPRSNPRPAKARGLAVRKEKPAPRTTPSSTASPGPPAL